MRFQIHLKSLVYESLKCSFYFSVGIVHLLYSCETSYFCSYFSLFSRCTFTDSQYELNWKGLTRTIQSNSQSCTAPSPKNNNRCWDHCPNASWKLSGWCCDQFPHRDSGLFFFLLYKPASISSLQSTFQSQQKLVLKKPASYIFILS